MGTLAYIVVGLVLVHTDAILCFALKRRFRLLPSLLLFAAWPITLTVAVLAIAALTRNMPPTHTPVAGGGNGRG